MITLHSNTQDFTELIQLTATHFGISPDFVEKDYWITFVLKRLAVSANTGSIVFRRIILEINSFANPYPYAKQTITSFIADFLNAIDQKEAIEKYGLQPFSINVLDKSRTMVEKLISLIRFSFDESPVKAIASKIRHFYDLYFLVNDEQCKTYLYSDSFKRDFAVLYTHDQQTFDTPRAGKANPLDIHHS